nr:RNA 2',3'-cyclic phosphodiesterase [uncultured Acetatifactor sp.]
MRLFIAINLSSAMKDALINIQNAFYDAGVRGNYTSEENLHLTLAFIGEYPDAESVMDSLAAVSFTPFAISLDGIGSYDNLWWAGISRSPALDAVVRRIRRALAENGIPFDRKKFSPHITLLRKASGSSMPPLSTENVSAAVESISLMSSDRGKRGMIYTEAGALTAEGASE